ncbi:pentatricopeptide repeat-containing At1g09190 [Olea europaea subsp. europaea]|uniref:Pentatricopeptide repeat-containing At1g09190 n=1 Tax=Olea europaea subsp. europaea TaxID=158383 RepID=A0A8S0R236_OLEEU|nr:pentatricopeptide repeat-containing At1g09190 [Olea europaea subsp. europaea]
MSRGSREIERRLLRLLHGRDTRTHLTEIHGHLLRHQLHHSNQLLSHFISICSSLSKMPYAQRIFLQAANPNIFLFNSMIKGYSLCGPFENSFCMFSVMKKRGIWPDEFTFAPLLKACANFGDLKLGRGVHKEVLVLGFARFGSIRIGIVELYVNCERMVEAKRVFDKMSHRDVIVWNLMIRGYCKSGNVEMGLRLFRQMSERSVVSWNTMISCLAQSGRDIEALEIFREMLCEGLEPDEATVVTMLPVCAHLGEINIGRWVHSYVESSGLYNDFVSVGNALMDFYCKTAELEKAFEVFKDMPRKNVVSWNAMISGLAFNGKGELGVEMFEEMTNHEGTSPNDATLVAVLACCVHAGLVQRGRDFFASMAKHYHIKPKLEHYGCMVDLLSRSGCVKEAYDLIRIMPMKPNAAIWGALLSACRTYGDMELVEHAVKWLINLEPQNSGHYVLLSNIYAERGNWSGVEEVRILMKESRVNKTMGQSIVG